MKRILLTGFLTLFAAPAFATTCSNTSPQLKDNTPTTFNAPYIDDGTGSGDCEPKINVDTSTSNVAKETGGNLATVVTETTATAGVAGTTSGTAVTSDANGTLQQYLRGIVKQINAVFSTSGAATSWLTVWVQNAVAPGQATMSASSPVAIASDQSAVATKLQATASGGWTPKWFVAANSDNATNLKSSAGTVHAVQVFGIDASPAWLKFYNTSSSPTCASSTIVKQILIPANSTAANGAGAIGTVLDVAFSTGISYCVVKGIAATDDTSVDAASYVINIDYN